VGSVCSCRGRRCFRATKSYIQRPRQGQLLRGLPVEPCVLFPPDDAAWAGLGNAVANCDRGGTSKLPAGFREKLRRSCRGGFEGPIGRLVTNGASSKFLRFRELARDGLLRLFQPELHVILGGLDGWHAETTQLNRDGKVRAHAFCGAGGSQDLARRNHFLCWMKSGKWKKPFEGPFWKGGPAGPIGDWGGGRRMESCQARWGT